VVGLAACIFASAGLCGAVAIAGVAINAATRITGKYGGSGESWASIGVNTGIDFGLAFLPAARYVGKVGRHHNLYNSAVRGWSPPLRQVYRYRPEITRMRIIGIASSTGQALRR
jgi:hypothetical protein